MAKSLLLNILVDILGNYVEDLTKDNLKLAVWSGTIELYNLKLKQTALDKLNLPVKVLRGSLKKLQLKIPWTNLESKPVSVLMDGMYLETGPVDLSEVSAADAQKMVSKSRLKKMEKAEKAIMAIIHNKSFKRKKKSSYMKQLTAKIIDNLEIMITNLHFRYEDHDSIPGSMISFGITIESVSLQTTDDNWNPTYVNREDDKNNHDGKNGPAAGTGTGGLPNRKGVTIHKIGAVTNLCVYWNSASYDYVKSRRFRAAASLLLTAVKRKHPTAVVGSGAGTGGGSSLGGAPNSYANSGVGAGAGMVGSQQQQQQQSAPGAGRLQVKLPPPSGAGTAVASPSGSTAGSGSGAVAGAAATAGAAPQGFSFFDNNAAAADTEEEKARLKWEAKMQSMIYTDTESKSKSRGGGTGAYRSNGQGQGQGGTQLFGSPAGKGNAPFPSFDHEQAAAAAAGGGAGYGAGYGGYGGEESMSFKAADGSGADDPSVGGEDSNEPAENIRYILRPPNKITVKLSSRDLCTETNPNTDITITSTTIQCKLQDDQYRQITTLQKILKGLDRRKLMLYHRPPARPHGADAKAWWHYAYFLATGNYPMRRNKVYRTCLFLFFFIFHHIYILCVCVCTFSCM
jgi:hypothetical protein